MSKLEIKRTINTEIEDKRKRLLLIESDKKAYGENLDDALSDCKKRIQELRKENSKLRKQLFEKLKSDENIINEAFQRNACDRAMFVKRTCSEALEILNYKVCGKVKHLNLLKHLTQIKCVKLENIDNQFKTLTFEILYVNDTLSGHNKEGQELRNLENRLDKATLKYGEASQINKVYIQIISKLQDEYLQYGNNLDSLENEISESRKDLCKLLVMKTDAEMARDAAINELHIKEEIIHQDKKMREKELNYMKQVAENIQSNIGKLDKLIPRESNLPIDLQCVSYMGLSDEEREIKIKKFEDCYKHIRNVSGVLSIQEAVMRFENQNNIKMQLQKIIENLEKQNIKHLKERLKYNSKLFMDKYETGTNEYNNEDTIINITNDLTKKELLNINIQKKLYEGNVILALCKLSIEHISEILPSFRSKLSTTNNPKYDFKDYIIDLFNKCEIVTTNLMTEINEIQDIDHCIKMCFPPVLETFNEFHSNITKNITVHNTRIVIIDNLKNINDDEDQDNGEDDNNLPTRRSLKKQAFQFVESKTKKVTKKKKKPKEK